MKATIMNLFFSRLMTELLWVFDGWAVEIMEAEITVSSVATTVSAWWLITPWKLLVSSVRQSENHQPL